MAGGCLVEKLPDWQPVSSALAQQGEDVLVRRVQFRRWRYWLGNHRLWGVGRRHNCADDDHELTTQTRCPPKCRAKGIPAAPHHHPDSSISHKYQAGHKVGLLTAPWPCSRGASRTRIQKEKWHRGPWRLSLRAT